MGDPEGAYGIFALTFRMFPAQILLSDFKDLVGT